MRDWCVTWWCRLLRINSAQMLHQASPLNGSCPTRSGWRSSPTSGRLRAGQQSSSQCSAKLMEVHSKRQVWFSIEYVIHMMKFGYTIVYVPDVLASVEFFLKRIWLKATIRSWIGLRRIGNRCYSTCICDSWTWWIKFAKRFRKAKSVRNR